MAGMKGPANSEKGRLVQSCRMVPTTRSLVKRLIYRSERLDSGSPDVECLNFERGKCPESGRFPI
jgi:hypothetical protein